jgi:hypothetical protein
MNKFLMHLMMRGGYMAPEGEGGSGGGGVGGASGGDDEAAKLAAAAKEAERAEAERAEAERVRGKKPSDEEAALLREVMDKKDKLRATATQLEQANARLKEFDGLDPKELRALVQAKKDAEIAQLEAKGQWDSLKAQMVEQHGKELQAERDGKSAAEQRVVELASQIAELTVGNAFGTSKFIAEELTLSVAKARRVYGSHFEFKDGGVVAFDKPAGSKDRNVLVDSKGEPLAFEAAIEKLVELDPDKDTLRKSKLKAGAGSITNAASVPGAKPNSATVGTGRSKIAAGLAKAGLK